MKADDDMYINLDRLYATVQANKRPNLLMGSLICNAIPIKDPYNKWYVPQYMFAGKRYPNYLSGNSKINGSNSSQTVSCSICFRNFIPHGKNNCGKAVQRQPGHPHVPPGGHLRDGDALCQGQDQASGQHWLLLRQEETQLLPLQTVNIHPQSKAD